MLKFKEFILEDHRVVVHCNTRQKANNLLAWAHSKGKTWCNKELYSNNTCWDMYKEWTCYDVVNGRVDSKIITTVNPVDPKCILTYEEVVLYD